MHTKFPGRTRLLLALACGLVHGGFSFYWAAGGEWLLETVGDGAVEMVRGSALGAAASLGLVGLVKTAGAVVPVLATAGRLWWPRFWRVLSGVGGVGLVLYGGLSTAVPSAVLLGWVPVEGGYDRTALLGHALLWDPLFLAWGVLLVWGLWASRATTGRRSTSASAITTVPSPSPGAASCK